MLSFPALAVAFSLISLVMSNALDEGAVCPLETVNTKRSPDGPHFVVYADQYTGSVTGPPDVSEVEGFTVFTLSFLLVGGPYDKAYEWTSLSDSERQVIKKQYNDKGIKLIVSAFGATDIPTTIGANPLDTANDFADWVIEYDLDGMDVDYEDFAAFELGTRAEDWLISFTKQLRSRLPAPDYIISHAPVAPWFSPNVYAGGGYLRVHEEVGDMIDWYNVQFYNQGQDEYTTCDNLLNESSEKWPGSALFQISENGVPLSKLVVGKPGTSSDAENGYMSTETLAECLQTAQAAGWDGGAMVWQFPGANSAWIKDVRSLSWPV